MPGFEQSLEMHLLVKDSDNRLIRRDVLVGKGTALEVVAMCELHAIIGKKWGARPPPPKLRNVDEAVETAKELDATIRGKREAAL